MRLIVIGKNSEIPRNVFASFLHQSAWTLPRGVRPGTGEQVLSGAGELNIHARPHSGLEPSE